MFLTKRLNWCIAALLFTTTFVNAQIITPGSFGKGINFMSEDSSMTMKFQFRMQHLFDANYNTTSEDFSSQYLVRRSRLKFSGKVNPKLKYKAELGLTNRDMSVSSEDGNGKGASRMILDAVLKYQFADHWNVWMGQTKLPGNRERVISSADLQFVNRSNLNSKFNLDRDMGIQLHGKYKLGKAILQPKFAWTMGEGRDITSDNAGGYNYTTRVDFLPLGAFEGKKQDYISSDHKRQSKPKLAIGVTYNYNDGAVRQQGQLGKFVYLLDSLGENTVYAENSLSAIQADAFFKYKGVSIMTEYANTSAAKELSTNKKYHTGSAFNFQAGYLFESNIEIAGRYTTYAGDNNFSGLSDVDEYTLGVSKYIVGHKLKIQSDISWIDNLSKDEQSLRFRFQVEMQL